MSGMWGGRRVLDAGQSVTLNIYRQLLLLLLLVVVVVVIFVVVVVEVYLLLLLLLLSLVPLLLLLLCISKVVESSSRESIEVRESTRVVLGDIQKDNWCGVLLTLVSCRPRSLRDLPP